MASFDHMTEPRLSEPVLAPNRIRAAPVAVGATAAIAMAGMIWFFAPGVDDDAPAAPASVADLGESVFTPVNAGNGSAVAAAVAALRLSDPQRKQIEEQVRQNQRRLGWIVLVDSMDPDGDAIAIESAGLVQNVVLSKAWLPVAVAIGDAGPISISAVRDGGGGGITLALATRHGPMTLRALLPGERIEVMP